jgi:trehalose 6-phosphate synthase
MRLVVVSNRVALETGKIAAGGLAVALTAALEELHGLWFGWSGTLGEELSDRPHLIERDGITYATVDLDPEDFSGYYKGYANQTLWPLFHYRPDLASANHGFFESYRKVNTLFARQLAEMLKPGDIVWVHDYHLIPLGEELRQLGVKVPIGFFLHTPFPVPQIMTALFNHQTLLPSLLAYDLVGFQTPDDLRAFEDYVTQELGGTISNSHLARHAGRTVQGGVFPIGLDPDAFAALAVSEEAQHHHQQVLKSLAGRDLVIGVDRLDYSKGLPERLKGIECLLANHPERCGTLTLVQIAASSRSDLPEYIDIREELEITCGRINGRFSKYDWVPIRYVNRPYSQAALAGLYRAAKVGLVTSLRDGMNLVAKEYVAAQDPEDPGVLVLSQFAGASHELEQALIVNPYDVRAIGEAVDQALHMPLAERRERWCNMMDVLRRNDITRWRERFVTALQLAT